MKSPEFGIQGTNGIGVGPANPFGEQYGWYAQQIFDRVGQKWNRADVTSRPHARAMVRFTLLRDGTSAELEAFAAQRKLHPGHLGATRGAGCRAASPVSARLSL